MNKATEYVEVKRCKPNDFYLLATVENRTDGIVVVTFLTEAAEEFAYPIILTPFTRTYGIFAETVGSPMLEALERGDFDAKYFSCEDKKAAFEYFRDAGVPSWEH